MVTRRSLRTRLRKLLWQVRWIARTVDSELRRLAAESTDTRLTLEDLWLLARRYLTPILLVTFVLTAILWMAAGL
jgi:hypothetical protein